MKVLLIIFIGILIWASISDTRSENRYNKIKRKEADEKIAELKKKFEERKAQGISEGLEIHLRGQMEKQIEEIEREVNPPTQAQLDKQRAMRVHAEANRLMYF